MYDLTDMISEQPECEIIGDGDDIYIVLDGERIAKRGRPGTKQAGTWVVLEPGYAVHDDDDGNIVVEVTEPPRLH